MAAAEKIVRQSTDAALANVLAKKDARVSEYGRIADRLDCPLWILFIPGMHDHPELLQDDGQGRLRRLVENYLAMDDRGRRGIDVLAEHAARS